MPRYEFVEGNSSKFWEIERDGSSFTVRYGKIGSDGQTSTKTFRSEAEARKEHDKLVASKVKKGYSLVSEDEEDEEDDTPEEIPPFETHPELERAIIAEPDAHEPWLVYADWLQSRDDPRGALIAAHERNDKKASKALLEAHSAAFYGRFAPNKGDLARYAQITWRMGFWHKVKLLCEFDETDELAEFGGIAAVLERILRHPSARVLQSLSLGITEGIDEGSPSWQACLDVLARSGVRPTLRELFVGDFDRDECEISWADVGSLAEVWAVLPALQRLTVKGGQIALGPIEAPALTELRLWSGGLPKEPVERLCSATLPRLAHLELWFGAEDYGAECASTDIAPLLAGGGKPALTSLGLMNTELSDELPALLAESALLPRLQALDLSMGTLSDAGGQALLDRAAAFKHLGKLVLDRNYLSKSMVTKLKRAFPNAQIKAQQQAEDGDRYVSVGE